MTDRFEDDENRSSGPAQADLRRALGDGDPQKIRILIEAGADVLYQDEYGYDALIDAVHGRDVLRDPRLLDFLALLISHGVKLSTVTRYNESALRVLSYLGRFDAVEFLLKAGADRGHLEWTPLMESVALGSLAQVRTILETEPSLEATDWWSRTAYLIALQTGDIEKATILLDRGADSTACGRCGMPPLFYAIHNHHPGMLQWLLQHGADVHQTDEFGRTALMEAAAYDDAECVDLLIESGANVEEDCNGTALKRANSRRVIQRLLDAGADPADADQRILLGMPPDEQGEHAEEALAKVSPDEFRRSAGRRFGQHNPERMDVPFWEAMIRAGVSAYTADRYFESEQRTVDEPIWCAQRFGQSLTFLSDGRAIQIGGEHEDHYHSDFCIYNDVFLHAPDGSVATYGYPQELFPPTDFHTAMLVGDFIYVIGSLGYMGTRRYETTPIYRLHIHSLEIEHVEADGEAPGWIYKHRALALNDEEIRIWGGKRITYSDHKEAHGDNHASFVFDLNRLHWTIE